MLLEYISENMLLEPQFIEMLAKSASKRYKKTFIKKKDGSDRIIHQPSRELKAIQRVIHNDILSKLPVSRKTCTRPLPDFRFDEERLLLPPTSVTARLMPRCPTESSLRNSHVPEKSTPAGATAAFAIGGITSLIAQPPVDASTTIKTHRCSRDIT